MKLSNKTALSPIYLNIDRLLSWIARLGAVAMVALVTITMYDVLTRYFSIPKFGNLNSTMLQESEYWAHAILFSLVMAYGMTRQVHVRIDLVRDMMPVKVKYAMEIFGIAVFLLPFSYISARYCFDYALKSYVDGEISASTVGLTNLWILKSMIFIMFSTLFLAGISQLLKAIDGLLGNLTERDETRVLGGGH